MSETTNLKLFKHDNPETNTDQFDVDKSLNGNWDKLDKAVGQANTKIATLEKDNTTNKTDITNIKTEQTIQNTELEKLKAENERLRDDLSGLPTGTLQGETIYITDSAEMRFSKFNVRGNSRQESRSGKNKLNCNLINNSETKNGVTATKNKDGSYTFKGTSTDNVTFYLTRNMNLEVTKTMIGSGQNNLTGLVYNVQYYKKGDTTLTYARFQGNIFNEGDIIDSIYIQSSSVNVTVSGTIFPQLEEGTTITDYEQYGASPSPDYPSEVESCGDNVNILQNSAETFTTYGVTGTIQNDESIKVTGTSTTSNNLYLIGMKKILAKDIQAGDYTFSFKNKSIMNIVSIRLRKSNGTTKTQIDSFSLDSINKTRTLNLKSLIDTDTTEIELDVVCYGTNTFNFVIYPKVEKGTKATQYTPYGQGCINEVVCNKNLFDKNESIISKRYFGTNGQIETATATNAYLQEKYIYVKPNTQYTLSGGTYIRICEYDKNKNFIKITNSGTSNNITITTSSETKYIRVSFNGNLDDMQIEKGTTVTDIVEHQSQTFSIPTQQPMRAIRDIRDTFVKVDGKWYERHYIKELIFNGSEHFIFDGVYNNIYQFSSEISNLMNDITEEDINVKSNYFNGIRWRNSWLQDNSISCMISYKKLRFYTSKFTTVDEFKAWLSSNNVRAYYPLITPTDIECTPEQSTILDNLENTVKSYKGVTHIYTTDEVAPNVEVTYKKDLETIINNIQAIAINNASEEV